ncbi:OmpA family protein [Variovorax guangxiensis]|uniref:Outer membrane protein OmpA-like peptidoglycan-associated protein n=1 Tax=Variovorax guangxiensis TaxID=1775474 RepID=A0A840G3A1_9BURK|nr:OmpA family protein [Variovorax guangxiensis]MBB4225767.1 outer membrane protein OmpA-like peptidoglycan-associated protein [Variovorax guangxiensis]
MKTHNAIQRLALTALVAVLGACASGTQAPGQAGAAPAATESVRFPEAGSAWLKGGTFVNVEQLRRVGRGMTKNQVRELISYPHFSEGLFGPKEWDYLFNFRTGRGDEFVTCQYKVVYKDGLSDAMYWKDPACAGYVAVKAEVVAPVPAAAVAAAPQRFKLAADALFAFDKSDMADMSADGRAQLDQLAAQLKGQYKRFDTITVIGHTDRLGGDIYNQALSAARAATVRDYLIAQGLPRSALRAFGVGKTQPLVSCNDGGSRSQLIACLQPNRRVELEVSGER